MEQLKLALDPPKVLVCSPDEVWPATTRPVLHCEGCDHDLTPGDIDLRVNRTYSYLGYQFYFGEPPRITMDSDAQEWEDDVESWHCARCGAEIELPEGTEIQWT